MEAHGQNELVPDKITRQGLDCLIGNFEASGIYTFQLQLVCKYGVEGIFTQMAQPQKALPQPLAMDQLLTQCL